MKIVECRGEHWEIGETVGEALREEIKEHIAELPLREDEKLRKDIYHFVNSMTQYLPEILQQLKGMAKGASVAEERIFALNLPNRENGSADPAFEQQCSNVVFVGGPDSPLWGKNNDGLGNRRNVCILKIYPKDGIPVICFTYCGWLSGGDMMNAEGVTVGHASVGSKFLQSPYHVPVLQWLYAGMFKVRTAKEWARHITSLPLRGKGFTQVTIDKRDEMFSTEIACPLVQIRWTKPGSKGINCVNCYQLPFLKDFTNRTLEQIKNAVGRSNFLESETENGDRNLQHLKKILRYHGQFSICRHGGKDEAYTEYSIIGIPRERKALFAHGNPCQTHYQEITL